MAWVSPKVYAILRQSEEGKDIIERLPDLTQEECQEELDAFFGDGGKGVSKNQEYRQAKFDDETEEKRYNDITNEKISEKDLDDEEDFKEVTDEDISETLADYEWQITDSTTVDDYARETAEKLGIDKQRVLDVIMNEAPDKITPDMKMFKVVGFDDENEEEDEAKQSYGNSKLDKLKNGNILDINEEKVFKPTEKTIWDDMEHPLYGIPPSEQNENYLSEAIQEMEKYSRNWNTMPRRDKSNISPEGKKYLEMNLNRYKKALEYIKNGGK